MPEEAVQTNMEYNAFLHYLKSAANFNNSADTKDTKDENTSPTLQVNNPIINRPLHSVSSGNLARRTTSFKNFKNIQQSCKRSCTNSHESEIPGTSSEINLTIVSKSSELIDEFDKKTI